MLEKDFRIIERTLTFTKILKKSICEQYNLVNGKKYPFKSAAKVAFAHYRDIAQKVETLELALRVKVVKNFEKK